MADADKPSSLLTFWKDQLRTDGGQLQVALEVFSTLAVAVAVGIVLPAFFVGSYSLVLLSLACCIIVRALPQSLAHCTWLTTIGRFHICCCLQASLCRPCGGMWPPRAARVIMASGACF